MKQYYVVVEDSQFKEFVHQDLLSETGSETVPARVVDCVDSMPFSERNGIFMLTDAEAEALKNDIRVTDVHLSAEDMGAVTRHFGTKTGQFDKTNTPSSSAKNWGLVRCISATNNFGTSLTATTYTYNLTGKGVDVIIMDTGVEPWHPEFAVNADGTGGTRVVNHDWTQYGAITSVPTGGFLGDCDGHGSNVASIVAGNTCGWAPEATIYTLRVVGDGSGGPYTDIVDGRTLTLVNQIQAWQTIRLFHNAKAVDPETGYKRPTIVNCSYGSSVVYQNMTSVTYRGTTHVTNTTSGNASLCYGTIGYPDSPQGDGSCPYRDAATDAEVASAIAAGVIVVGAAGNGSHKIDVPGGLDYNNYWTSSVYGNFYYHRGATPTAVPGVICTGAISYSIPEHKASFSETGPRIDIWSPGYYIAGAWSSAAYSGTSPAADPRSSVSTNSGATYYLHKISGTSQASPQIAGISALFTQLRPASTTTTVRSWITGTGVKSMLDETFYGLFVNTGTYTNWASMQGAFNNYAYMPYNLPDPITIT